MAQADDSDNSDSDAKGKGKSSFNPISFTAVMEHSSKGSFWVWVLILAIAIWVFSKLQLVKVIPWQIVFTALFIAWIIIGFVSARKKDGTVDDTNIFIALVLIIWLIDMYPSNLWPLSSLGISWPEYHGFEWPISDNGWTVTIISILTSTVMFSFLYINMVYEIIKKKHVAYVGSGLFIIIINTIVAHYLPNTVFSGKIHVPNFIFILFLVLAVLGALALLILARKLKNTRENRVSDIFSDIFMVFVFSFFWINDGWVSNTRAVIHLIFIMIFGFVYVMPRETDFGWHLIIPLLLIFDFYGYGFFWSTNILWLQFIPVLVLFVVTYCYGKEWKVERRSNVYALVTYIFIATIILLLSLQASAYDSNGTIEFNVQKKKPYTQLFEAIGNNIQSSKGFVVGKIDEASGGYFLSQVEKNQYEPLGVYFSDIRAAQPRFYSDEDVTLWSTIKSRTLNDPVLVNFTCSRWDNGVRKLSGSEDLLIPKEPFTVYTLEETDTECTFTQTPEKTKFPVGTNTITLSASYNFETSAYQKLYFIDKERLRAMTRESLDPYKEFGITEKEPPTIHTNGPVELALKMQYLTAVSDDSIIQPNLGILIQNRNTISDKNGKPIGKWDGKVKKINDLVIILPEGMELDGPSCRPATFSTLIDTDNYCSDSCILLCKNTCFEYAETNPKRQQCNSECDSQISQNAIKCFSDCKGNFRSDDPNEKYTAYRMNTNELYTNDNEYRDFDRHKTFGCRINVTSQVLENVPITTKFIRAVARYDYSVDFNYPVEIQQPKVSNTNPPITYVPSNINYDDYLRSKNSPLAGIGQCIKDTETRTKVPAPVILAVAIHESNWGKSGLAQDSKNLFGYKCTTSYIDSKCTFADKSKCCKDYSKSKLDRTYEPNAPNTYREYQDWCESINDFGDLISSTDRYKNTLQFTNQPQTMVEKIRESGYATDPNWATGVNNIMRDIP